MHIPPQSLETRWPHAPLHLIVQSGVYMMTGATFQKRPFLNSPEKLDFFMKILTDCVSEFNWELHAWAVMSNHYHLVAEVPGDQDRTIRFFSKLHQQTSKELNRVDHTPGRKVWFQYWDSLITYETSYLTRLAYVHSNPVHHRLVLDAVDYPWCSAAWFRKNAPASFVETIGRLKTDKLAIFDEY